MPDPVDTDSLAQLEREYLAAVGWAAVHGRPAAVDPTLLHDPARRRIAEAIATQTAEHGATTWTAVYDTIAHAAARDDTAARDALIEVPKVPTADGTPHALPALVDRLQAAANRRRRWNRACQTIHELSGGRARIVHDQ